MSDLLRLLRELLGQAVESTTTSTASVTATAAAVTAGTVPVTARGDPNEPAADSESGLRDRCDRCDRFSTQGVAEHAESHRFTVGVRYRGKRIDRLHPIPGAARAQLEGLGYPR